MNLIDIVQGKHTAQEVFDFALTKIREQGKPSMQLNEYNGVEACLYRGPNNTKCAIGHMIPDSDYDPEIERQDINTAVQIMYPGFGYLNHNTYPMRCLLQKLQQAHDNASPKNFLSEFENSMSELAHELDLIYTPPN